MTLYILILIGILILLGVILFSLDRQHQRIRKAHGEVINEPSPHIPEECCGQHEVCERDSLLSAVSKEIEYYDDEELDEWKGTSSHAYSEQQCATFRNILYTMRNDEVAGWVRSLQLRGIELPDEIKDEVLLIMCERRNKIE